VRVLLVSEQYRTSRSGVGTYARGLAEGLIAAGHEVALAVSREEAPEESELRVIPLDTPPGNLTMLNRRARARAVNRALAMESGRHDLVHFLDARWGVEVSGAPAVGTVHDSYALDWTAPDYPRARYPDRLLRSWHYRWLRRHERRTYRGFSLLLANSRHVASAIGDGYDLERGRIRVVRLGLARDDSEPASTTIEGRPAVLFVGTNFTRKGLTELIEACRTLRESHPGLLLTVVGGDRKVRHFESRPGADAVRFLPLQPPERVRAMMAAADVFAMPSHVEAWGLVYLEAMRAGVPVVATANGGLGECFEDGKDVVLAAPGDAEALARTLRGIVDDPGRAERIGDAGRAAAAAFTMEKTVSETVAAYEEAI
jgi:glycosyltransferase involved in cell wall biosynthesis